MRLSSNERRELASFFAKRLTTNLTPRSGEPVDVQGWDRLLEDSDPRLLARRAARVLPDDLNLQALSRTLDAGGRRTLGRRIAAGAVAAAAAGIVGLVALSDRETTAAEPIAEQPLALTAKTLVQEAPPRAPLEARVRPAPPIIDTQPEVAEVEQPEVEVRPPAPTVPVVASAEVKCAEGPEGLVGYWYAGADRPGGAGDLVEVPHEINVRADYPDEHNRFNARAEVQCILQPGEMVRLSVDPIRVPGDAYWVPLRRTDLTG